MRKNNYKILEEALSKIQERILFLVSQDKGDKEACLHLLDGECVRSHREKISSCRRSDSFVVRGDSWLAICCANASLEQAMAA
jgi:hypothetical protein